MRADWRVRAIGVLVTAAAVPVAVLVDEPLGGMLATALAVTGLFVAIVVAERAVPAPAANAVLTGDAVLLSDVARGLGATARALYVPEQGNVKGERLFLPASENARPVPVLDADTLVYTGTGGTKAGLAVRPAGLALVDAHEDATGTRVAGAPVPEAEAFLKGLGLANDVARGVRVTRDGPTFTVRFAAAALAPACFDDPTNPVCDRTGCALCQATGCTLARSLARPVRVTRADVTPPWVTLAFAPADEPEEEGDA